MLVGFVKHNNRKHRMLWHQTYISMLKQVEDQQHKQMFFCGFVACEESLLTTSKLQGRHKYSANRYLVSLCFTHTIA